MNRAMANYKDKKGTVPVLIRANQAGVYMGHIIGKSAKLKDALELECRHIWSWNERLATTQVAHSGPGSDSACGPTVTMAIPANDIVAVIDVTEEGWADLCNQEVKIKSR